MTLAMAVGADAGSNRPVVVSESDAAAGLADEMETLYELVRQVVDRRSGLGIAGLLPLLESLGAAEPLPAEVSSEQGVSPWFCARFLTDEALETLRKLLDELLSARPYAHLRRATTTARTRVTNELALRLFCLAPGSDWARQPGACESEVPTRVAAMQTAGRSVWTVATSTAARPWMLRELPRRLGLVPELERPFDGQEAGLAMTQQAQGLRRQLGGAAKGHVGWVDDLARQGLNPPTDGTSTGLAQAVLWATAAGCLPLPAHWAFLGNARPARMDLAPLDPIVFCAKLEALLSHGGFTTIWAAAGQELARPASAEFAGRLGIRLEWVGPSLAEALQVVSSRLPTPRAPGAAGVLASIRQPRPSFRVSLWPSLAGAQPAARDAPGMREGSTGRQYRPGDSIVLSVQVEHDCYVVLLCAGAGGKAAVLFPNRWHPDCYLRAGAVRRLPEDQDDFVWELHPPSGTETVMAIATVNRPAFLKSLELSVDGPVTPLTEARVEELAAALRGLPDSDWAAASCRIDW